MPSLQNLLFSVRHWMSHCNVIDVMFELLLIHRELEKAFCGHCQKISPLPVNHNMIMMSYANRAPNSSAKKIRNQEDWFFEMMRVEVAERNCWPSVIFQFPCNFPPPPSLAQNVHLQYFIVYNARKYIKERVKKILGLSPKSVPPPGIHGFCGPICVCWKTLQNNYNLYLELDYRTTVLISGRQRKAWHFFFDTWRHELVLGGTWSV